MTEPTMIRRRYVLFTDHEDIAMSEVLTRRSASSMTGRAYRGWDMAEVADLIDPPETTARYCVFQILENK